jgi:hypothetical protein
MDSLGYRTRRLARAFRFGEQFVYIRGALAGGADSHPQIARIEKELVDG